jgi:hypothetical protein
LNTQSARIPTLDLVPEIEETWDDPMTGAVHSRSWRDPRFAFHWFFICLCVLAAGLAVEAAPWLALGLTAVGVAFVLYLVGSVAYLVAAVTIGVVMADSPLVGSLGVATKLVQYGPAAAVVVATLVSRLVRPVAQPRVRWQFAAWFLGFSCLAFTSYFWSASPALTLFRSTGLLLLVVATAIAVPLVIRTPADVMRILTVLGAVASAVVLVSLALSAIGLVPALSSERYAGILHNPNTIGYLVAPILPSIVLATAHAQRHRQRNWLALEAAVMVIGVVLSGSRGGFFASVLGVAAGAFAIIWTKRKHATRRIITIALIAVLAGAGTLYFLNRPLRPAGGGGFISDLGTGSNRTTLWVEGVHIVGQHPWLGTGYGTTSAVLPAIVLGQTVAVHSSIVEAAIELGLPGLLWMVILALSGGFAAWSVARRAGPWQNVGVVLLAGIVGGIVEVQVESGLTNMAAQLAFNFWLLVGIAHSIRFRNGAY